MILFTMIRIYFYYFNQFIANYQFNTVLFCLHKSEYKIIHYKSNAIIKKSPIC